MVTPFGVTSEWMGVYLHSLRDGQCEREARRAANIACRVSDKQFARCAITTGVLTVPVQGGGSVLKRRDADPVLSEHGKWRREHLGAWNAAYGRTPYYVHLMPQIEAVYMHSEGLRLEEFASRLLDIAQNWLDSEAIDAPLPGGVREEMRQHIRHDLSIFDALFRLGKETVLGI